MKVAAESVLNKYSRLCISGSFTLATFENEEKLLSVPCNHSFITKYANPFPEWENSSSVKN